MPQECKLSIITVNYNGVNDTCALIDTIPSDDTIEVIVVDNASKSDEATLIAERYPFVKVIRSKENLGFAGGNNLGIRTAQGQYLFLINNDTVFKGSCQEIKKQFDALINRLDASPSIGMVCPKIRFAWGTHPIQFTGYTRLSPITIRNHSIGYGEEDYGQYESPHPTPYAHGAAMMLKREIIDKVGLMPECYFLYYEELDWSMMITRAGYEIWYDPCCTIYHKESQSTGQNSPLKTYFLSRNRLLLTKRNFSGFQKWLTYSYLIGIVGMRDVLKAIIFCKFDLAISTIKGIRDFIFYNNKA